MFKFKPSKAWLKNVDKHEAKQQKIMIRKDLPSLWIDKEYNEDPQISIRYPDGKVEHWDNRLGIWEESIFPEWTDKDFDSVGMRFMEYL